MADPLEDTVPLVFGAGSVGPRRGNDEATAALFAPSDHAAYITRIGLPLDGGLICRIA
jgi:hypothetical protein